MNIAIIKDNKVVNRIVCETLELAQQLIPDALCVDGEEFAIGDIYDASQVEVVEPVPDPDADRDAMLVDLDYRMTLLELGVN